MTKRLQVVIAHAGIASRRKAKDIIESGRVTVNGRIVKKAGFRVDENKDLIKVNGRYVSLEKKVYFILNKPGNSISTVKDTHRRKTILSLINIPDRRVYPVGRLDRNTKGLILLTNDGELSYALTHPKFNVEKIYRVKVKESMGDEKIQLLKKGVVLDGKRTCPCRIKLLKRSNYCTEFNIELHEGRKRQIRRMCQVVGHSVLDLERVSFAGLKLGSLKRGQFRSLTGQEVNYLKDLVDHRR